MHSFFKFLSKLNLILFSSVFLLFNIFQFSVFHHFSLFFPNFHVPTCIQLPFICSPNPHVTHLSRPVTVAGVAGVRHACNYIYPSCNSTSPEQLRTSHLHHRCLGAACSPAAPPVLQSQCTYCISLTLEPSPELPLYIFLQVSCTTHPLVHHCCTTAAPLRNLVQPFTTAPLRNLVH